MLTKRQHTCLMFIDGYVKRNGFCPSYDEISEGIGLASKSNTFRLLGALEQRGFVRRLKGRARAIEILKLPDAAQEGG